MRPDLEPSHLPPEPTRCRHQATLCAEPRQALGRGTEVPGDRRQVYSPPPPRLRCCPCLWSCILLCLCSTHLLTDLMSNMPPALTHKPNLEEHGLQGKDQTLLRPGDTGIHLSHMLTR